MLLYRGCGTLVLLDVGCDDDRLDAIKRFNAARFAPVEELTGSPRVREPRVLVSNRDGEKLEEAADAFGSRRLNRLR